MGDIKTISKHLNYNDSDQIGISIGIFEDSAMKGLKGDEDHIDNSCNNQTQECEAVKTGSTENIHMFLESDINATQYFEGNNGIENQQKQCQNVDDKKIVLLCDDDNKKEVVGRNNTCHKRKEQKEVSICIRKSSFSQQSKVSESQNANLQRLKTKGGNQLQIIQKKQTQYQSDFDISCQKIATKGDTNKESNLSDSKYETNHLITHNLIGRKSVLNYQKAANIVNNVISKSLNRVQRIDKHVKNFIQALQQKVMNRKLPNLQENQIRLLDDVSYYYQKRANEKLINKFFIKLQDFANLRNPLPVFMPTNPFRVYWDIFQTIFTYSFLYIYSILIFFAFKERDTDFIKQFFQYTFMVFLLDVMINFNTAYFNKDVIITKRKQIMWRYLSSNVFFTDAICLVIMGSKVVLQSRDLVYNPDSELFPFFINSLVFLKLNGINPKRERFGYVFTLRENQKHIMRLVNQLLSVVCVAHTVCLAWYTLGVYEYQNGYSTSWLQKYQYVDHTYLEQYIFSIYWSVTTMTTVGYGDIAASNHVEALFITFSMILFSCVFAYSINNIGFILQEIEKSSKDLNDNISTIQRYYFLRIFALLKGLFKLNTRYLNRKNVNIQLQSRVRHYLSFLAEEQKDRDQLAENQIFQILSNKLRNEIIIEINSRILKNYSIFSANFSTQTLRKLVFIMEEVLISPNEIIFEEGENFDQSLYLIESGNIEIYQVSSSTSNCTSLNQNKTHVLQSLNQGAIFGEISFFSGLGRKASARSTNLSTLYKINRSQFIELIKENSEDFERFKMMEEQVKFQQDLSILFIECYTCKTIGHISSQCPVIHSAIDKQFKILKNNFSIFQNRSVHIQRKQISRKSKPWLEVCFNQIVSKTLKEQLRNYNSYTEIIFKSDVEISEGCSEEEEEEEDEDDENQRSSGNEYNSSDSDTSISSNQDQSSLFQQQNEKQFVKKEKSNSQQYEVYKSLKSLKNFKSLKTAQRKSKHQNRKSKKDDSLKQVANIKETENFLILRDLSPKQKTSHEEIYMNDKLSDYSKRESIDRNEKKYEDFKDYMYQQQQNLDQNDNQNEYNNINKSLNSRNHNNSHLTIPSQKDVQQSSQLDNLDIPKKKYAQQKNYIYEKSISNEESNCNSNSLLDEQPIKQPQPQKPSVKSRKGTLRPQKTQKDIRTSVDILVSNTMYNALVSQSAAITNTQNEISRLESTISKLEERFSVFNSHNLKSMKSIESSQLNRRISSQQIASTLFQKQNNEFRQSQLGINNFNTPNKKLSVYKDSHEKKQSKLSIEVQGLPSHTELKQDVLQNTMLEKIYKMLDRSQAKDMSNRESQQIDDYSTINLYVTQNVLNKFDMIKNFKKFFPHNNFTSIFNKLYSKKLLFKNKKSKTQFQVQKTRRNNIILQLKTARKSIFCNAILQKPTPSQLDYNSYKPTFLSYGISQKSETIYPKFLIREAFI